MLSGDDQSDEDAFADIAKDEQHDKNDYLVAANEIIDAVNDGPEFGDKSNNIDMNALVKDVADRF